MKSLFVPLYTRWYEEFEAGTKTVEHRDYGPRWNERTCSIGRRTILSKGYGKQNRLEGTVKNFWVEDNTACIEIEGIKPWNGTL